MTSALLRRLGQLLFVSFGVSVLTFLMIHLIPGDAAQIMLGASDTDPGKVIALRAQLGLDQPLIAQYARCQEILAPRYGPASQCWKKSAAVSG